MDAKILSVRRALLDWFGRSKRDLPWRHGYNPYHVWISEIMLQQTQMERGVIYFRRWMKEFPDILAVANAGEREILKQWEGLGYYARARNLQRAAQIMVEHYQEQVPDSYEDLLKLPGIGPYTAAAIASIAYNCDIAVVDGNVERVIARLFDIDGPVKNAGVKKQVRQLAQELLPEGRARDFNQALMDLGGLVCTPKKPLCIECPVAKNCAALAAGRVSERPVVSPGTKIIPIEMATGVLAHQGRVFIQQRRLDDLWGGLWEFPGGRVKIGETPAEAVIREFREETDFVIEVARPIATVVHHYTRYKVTLHGFSCRFAEGGAEPVLHAARAFCWASPKELSEYGFPAGHRKLLDYMVTSGTSFL